MSQIMEVVSNSQHNTQPAESFRSRDSRSSGSNQSMTTSRRRRRVLRKKNPPLSQSYSKLMSNEKPVKTLSEKRSNENLISSREDSTTRVSSTHFAPVEMQQLESMQERRSTVDMIEQSKEVPLFNQENDRPRQQS